MIPEAAMDIEEERLRRANAALEAWVRDLLTENRQLRERLAQVEPHEGPSFEAESAAA